MLARKAITKNLLKSETLCSGADATSTPDRLRQERALAARAPRFAPFLYNEIHQTLQEPATFFAHPQPSAIAGRRKPSRAERSVAVLSRPMSAQS
jgi:hypothetical protein